MSLCPEQFPRLLAAAPKNFPRFEEAVRDIAAGLEAGEIRNVVLAEAKHRLGSILRAAWEASVAEPFFYGGKIDVQPKEVADLFRSISMWSASDVLTANRKLAKAAAAQGEAADAIRSFVAEALPLAETIKDLRGKVVKGRAKNPNGSIKPINPNKKVRTCPCCFRGIAVQGGTMAHHGYRRPGGGWQTASCPGIKFKPLEESNDGLVWLIGIVRTRLAGLEKTFAGKDSRDSLPVMKGRPPVEMTIVKGSPEWASVFKVFVANLENEIRWTRTNLEQLEKLLVEWRPVEEAARPQIPSLGM